MQQSQMQWLKYCINILYKSVINIAQNFGHVHNKNLIQTLDKYTLQTSTVSFLDHEKSLKEVDNG